MKKRTRLSVLPLELRVTPSAPIPVGPEFRVNTTTEAHQMYARTAMAADGDFVVVWRSRDGVTDKAFGQLYNAGGVPRGGEFQISGNGHLSGFEPNLDVAMDATGGFVVVWVEDGASGPSARRYNADGVPLGQAFPIASFAPGQRIGNIDMDAAGNWAVVWGADVGPPAIYCREFNASGTALGPEFALETPPPDYRQEAPKVAIADNGEGVFFWVTSNFFAGSYWSARRFNIANQSIGPSFPIDFHGYPRSLAIDAQGNFAITGAVGRLILRFASNGTPIGEPIELQQSPFFIAMDSAGNFVVTLRDIGSDGSEYGVFAQAFNAAGERLGDSFQVNTYTLNSQDGTGIAMNAAGDTVVVWQSYATLSFPPSPEGQDGSGSGVYAQRYRVGVPQVQSTQVNDGAAQRSRVTSLTVSFDTKVNFAGTVADAFTLIRNVGKPVSFTASASNVDGRTVVTLSNFTGGSTQFGSLADGRYTLTVLASQVTDNHGQHLDGDGDLQQGGNYTFGEAQGLYRLFGDINGDRRVDIADYGLFSLSYLNAANYVSALDFNRDGHIDIADYGQFSLRYLKPLP